MDTPITIDWPGGQVGEIHRAAAQALFREFGFTVEKFREAADIIEEAGAPVLMLYPGDVDDLAAKAKEFFGAKPLPSGIQALIDPGYEFTNAWKNYFRT